MVHKPSFGCLVQIRGQGCLQGRKSGGVLLREITEMAAVFEIRDTTCPGPLDLSVAVEPLDLYIAMDATLVTRLLLKSW